MWIHLMISNKSLRLCLFFLHFFPYLWNLDNIYWLIFKFTDFFLLPAQICCWAPLGNICFLIILFNSKISTFVFNCPYTDVLYLITHYCYLFFKQILFIIADWQPLSTKSITWVLSGTFSAGSFFQLCMWHIRLFSCISRNFFVENWTYR